MAVAECNQTNVWWPAQSVLVRPGWTTNIHKTSGNSPSNGDRLGHAIIFNNHPSLARTEATFHYVALSSLFRLVSVSQVLLVVGSSTVVVSTVTFNKLKDFVAI